MNLHKSQQISTNLKSTVFIILLTLFIIPSLSLAQNENIPEEIISPEDTDSILSQPIFDDKMLLDGYAQKYQAITKDILLEMIKDETLTSYKTAAAVRVFRQKYSNEVVSREKKLSERILLRRLNRADSPFLQVEILHTLCAIDRYRYFESTVPALIQKLDHYNSTVNELAFESLNSIIGATNTRTREARIVFNTLRKTLFLSRKRLANITTPGPKLSQKFKLLRWSIKVLGTQELKKLPKEVINLL